MTHTLTIYLTETEIKLLKKSAALACRRPQEEARFLLRNVLFGNEDTFRLVQPATNSLTDLQSDCVSELQP